MTTLNKKEQERKEAKNSQAYQDCLDGKEPSSPEDGVYMGYYRGWRAIAMYPEDTYYHNDRG